MLDIYGIYFMCRHNHMWDTWHIEFVDSLHLYLNSVNYNPGYGISLEQYSHLNMLALRPFTIQMTRNLK
jgi:hypothetical protein